MLVRSGWADRFVHEDGFSEEEPNRTLRCPETEQYAEPMEFCTYRTGSGDTCFVRIKPEDISGKMFACGRHMKLEVEAQDRKKRNEELQKELKSRKMLEEWVNEDRMRCYKLLNEKFPSVFPMENLRFGEVPRSVYINVEEMARAVREADDEDQDHEVGFVGGSDLPV